ncbi:putative zinc finger in N-recognin (UBR box) [Novymonas esmeraldas]|uniref:Zinc finger in N-recognin (UBR box) n=1 Tax=Novymonas esmeraldas TaxID=1808958 RepID=A0AAW0F563_9TRYP
MALSTREVYVDFEVKFGKSVVSLEMPVSATVRDLKQRLEEETHVRIAKQRLLLNAPVVKARQRDPPLATMIRALLPADLVARCEQHDGAVAQHVRVGAMLLGSVDAAPTVDVTAASEISRLVATTVEHDGKWYRCSYARGYLRQTAYVCRTCINEGRADPQHVLCLACAELCHGNHDVEEWGMRYHMRCDCCTQKCWRPPTDPKTAAAAAAARRAVQHPSAAQPSAEVWTLQTHEIEQRTMRKRTRSTSPLAPRRSRGSSPIGGIRMAAAPPPDMPEVSLHASSAASAVAPGAVAFPSAPPPTSSAAPAAAGSAHGHRDTTAVQDEREGEEEEGAEEGGAGAGDEQAERPPPPLPELHRCAFVVDSKTGKAPEASVLPVNRGNRYPRDSLHWCHCKSTQPSDDPECGGVACMLCCSCFWSTHITRLHTLQYRRLPCYGDVLLGDTVAFKCRTCNTHVCAPCRYRCHKDHDVEDVLVTPSRDDGTDNGALEGAQFSCGCRGLCAIAEEVPADMIDDVSTFAPIPDSVAVELMNEDIFSGFVCAACMQEHPWMATEDPLRCYGGQLPPPVLTKKPVIACGATATGDDSEVFPYHGMLLPVTAFTSGMTCPCEPCRAAFDAFAPRATEDATQMVMELHDYCDNCGAFIKDQQAFMCRTCEMHYEETFFICKDCNAMREILVQNTNRVRASTTMQPSEEEEPTSSSQAPPPASSSSPREADVVEGDGEAAQDSSHTYKHDLSHDFIEDTLDNLYGLCGMQVLQSTDPETQDYIASNWDPAVHRVELTNTLTQSLGQIPLQFSAEELQEIAELNQRHSGTEEESP